MSHHQALQDACRGGDYAAFGALADLLDEDGLATLAAAYRWCWLKRKRPVDRVTPKSRLVRKRWAWYRLGAKTLVPKGIDRDLCNECQYACLPRAIYYELPGARFVPSRMLYFSFDLALAHLADGLAAVRNALL